MGAGLSGVNINRCLPTNMALQSIDENLLLRTKLGSLEIGERAYQERAMKKCVLLLQ
jgi:hypothetical protein